MMTSKDSWTLSAVEAGGFGMESGSPIRVIKRRRMSYFALLVVVALPAAGAFAEPQSAEPIVQTRDSSRRGGMIFYEFSDNSVFEKEWTFAVSIQPRSHVVNWRCAECSRAAQFPAGGFDVTLEGGSKFPDFLGCGAYPLLIASERVVAAFEDSGITCFQKYTVGVADVQESQLRREDAPAYFRLEITGECMIDFAASGATIKSVCNHCGELKAQPPVIRRFGIVEGSWDGCDIFRDRRYFARVCFATPRVVELAKELHLTNCRFERMG